MRPRLPYLRRLCTLSRPTQIDHIDRSLLPELYPPSRTSFPPQKSLIRPCTFTLRDAINACLTPSSTPQPSLYLVDGLKGVGKTSLIHQTITYARLHGLIVLYLPNARTWTHGRGFFTAVEVQGMDPFLDGLEAVRYYDRPGELADVFDAMVNAHGDALRDIKCDRSMEDEMTEGCADLLQLVEKGQTYLKGLDSDWTKGCKGAGDVFGRMVRELCASDREVMVVIDDYEWMAGLTCMTNEKQERLHANCIRAVADFFGRDVIEQFARKMNKGFVVLVADQGFRYEEWRRTRVRGGRDYPLTEDVLDDISGRKWLNGLRERVNEDGGLVDVPQLSSPELKAICSTFVRGGLKKIVEGSAEESERLVALAAGRADSMRKIALCR